MKPLISIIVPVYNVENYLSKCIKSIITQSYRNIEVILVDDGSTDNSGKLCDQYKQKDERIVVYHKTNGGLSDARNYGIRFSRGEYITCVDSDDYIDLDYVEYLFNLINNDNTAMAICQHRIVHDGKDSIINDFGFDGHEILNGKDCIERMLYHDVIDTSAWGKLYKRELFDNLLYPVGRIYEDIGTTYKLMFKAEMISVGYESKYNYVMRNTSIVKSEFTPRKFDLLVMTDRMGKEVIKLYPDLKNAIIRRRVYARFSTLNQMSNTHDYENEKKVIIQFIKKFGPSVIRNPKAPKRDKIAILLLFLSYNIYKNAWDQFSRMYYK